MSAAPGPRGGRPSRIAGVLIAAGLLLAAGAPAAVAGPVPDDISDSEFPTPPPGSYTGPPNIVLILADDLGWGDLAGYGNQYVLTPRLDQLAAEGTRFTCYYAASTVGSPTRAAILTGRFPGAMAIHDAISDDSAWNQQRGVADWLDPGMPTVTGILGGAGYATACFGKWHLGSTPGAPSPGAYGIDDHVTTRSTGPTFPEAGQEHFRAESTRYVVDEAIRFIEDHQDVPFLVNVWALLPHATLHPTDAQLEVYDHLASTAVPYAGARRIYYGSITAMDEQVGRLVDRIDELGLGERTLIVFTSDNGPQHINTDTASHSGIGNPGSVRGMKWSLYEGGVRAPFIARWPGRVPQDVVDDTSVLAAVDLLPTLCTLAGVDPGELELDGENMSAALLGTPRARTTPLLWEWRFGPNRLRTIDRSPMLAIRSGPWKLLLNPDSSRVELYDVVADPSETDNVAGANPGIVAQLSAEALAWQASLPPGPVAEDAGTNEYPWP